MPGSARVDELQKKFNENPRRYFAPLADEYRKAGDLQAAIDLCRTHLAQQPGHMSGHIVLGKALYEGGDLDEARLTFETALGLDPENLIALRHLGDIARQQGDAYGARQWYQRVLDADPRNEDIAAQIEALDQMPATEAFGAAAAAPGASPGAEVELTPELEAAPDTLGESTLPDGTLPPALEPSAIAYLAEEPTLEVPAYRAPANGANETLDLDMSGLGFDTTTEAPRAAEPPQPAPPPPAAPANDIGLESMEFVAPSRAEPVQRAEGLERPDYDFDPHVVDGSVRGEATPAAFVTETMAELYLQQGFTDEALQVYRQLLEANPGDENLRARVQQLEGGGRSTLAFDLSEEVVRAAQERHARANRPTARRFFASLAARRAPVREWTPEQSPADYGHVEAAGTPSMDADHADAAPADAMPEDPYAYGATGVDTSAMDADALMGRHPDAGVSFDTPDAQAFDTQGYEPQGHEPQGHEPQGHEPQGYDSTPGAQAYDAGSHGTTAYETTGYDNAYGAASHEAPDAGVSGYGSSDTTSPGYGEQPAYDSTQGWDIVEEPRQEQPRETGEYDVAAFERASWSGSEPPSAPSPASSTTPGGSTAQGGAGGSVDALFGGGEASPADEAAASALAGAFAGTPAAIPAVRPATGELSLDQVFRETPRRADAQRRESSGFSFDQFFSEGSGTAPPTPPAAPAAPSPGEGADIEQFNAWLEGLKKK